MHVPVPVVDAATEEQLGDAVEDAARKEPAQDAAIEEPVESGAPTDEVGAPAELSELQKEQLLEAIEELRKSSKNVSTMHLGWTLVYNLRKQPGSSTRGDMMVIDPRDGQKLYSVVSVKRKLGLLAPPAHGPSADNTPAVPGASAAPSRRVFDWDQANLLVEGSRRSRTLINYAEAAGGGGGPPRTGDMILAAIGEADPNGTTGLDLADIALGVHDRGESENDTLPFVGVRLALKSLLKSGRVRRKLATMQLCSAGVPKAKEVPTHGGSGMRLALRMLLLQTLQVEEEEGAAWAWAAVAPPIAVAARKNDATAADQVEGETEDMAAQVKVEGALGEEDDEVVREGQEDMAETEDVPRHIAESLATAEGASAATASSDVRRAQFASQPDVAADAALHKAVRLRLRGCTAVGPLGPCDDAMEEDDFCVEDEPAPSRAKHGAGRQRSSTSKAKRRYPEAGSDEDAEDGGDVRRGSRRGAARAATSRGAQGSQAGLRAASRAKKSKYLDDSDWEIEEDEDEEESDEYEYVDDSADSDFDGRKKRSQKRVAGFGGGRGGAGSGPPFIEALLSVKDLTNMLPIADSECCVFRAPPGWTEEQVEGSRRRKSRWVQRGHDGVELRSFDRRQELEAVLEMEASSEGATWLGQLVGTTWEISPRAAPAAVTLVLDELVSLGVARRVSPAESGKAVPLYAVANAYVRGEAFIETEKRAKAALSVEERKEARRKRQEQKRQEEFEEAYDELAELEKQRLRNIERNKELLKQLGLA